jgi:hypothetical protein
MSEDHASEGLVSRADIAGLALLFDRSEFAIDPTSEDCKLAEIEFEDSMKRIFSEKVAPNHPEVSLIAYRCHVRGLCRKFLRKN